MHQPACGIVVSNVSRRGGDVTENAVTIAADASADAPEGTRIAAGDATEEAEEIRPKRRRRF